MNVSAAIIDQRVTALMEELRDRAKEELNISGDETKLKSLAFVFLCVRTLLDLDTDDAFDCLVEGGNDFGVDAIHITDERDGEFLVTLVQAKYSKSLEGASGFPATGLEKLAQAVRYLFDPNTTLNTINERLHVRVEEVRSLIRDGIIPQVRVIACNNGKRWESNGAEVIRVANLGDQVTWEYVNHEDIVKILKSTKPVNDRLQLTGKALVENMNFSRVLVGRVSVEEVYALIDRNGDRLLERNIRRYLGLRGNRVNEAIQGTLSREPSNFYFYNNGITLTCDKFSHNALQSGDFQIQVENLQIINGGQTCMTIHRTLKNSSAKGERSAPASVLLRLYELPSDNEDLVQRITYATNSQNPVDLRDLRANDERQQRLELDIEQLGYTYRRKRADHSTRPTDITSGAAAQAVLAVWRKRPHQAKFFSREHFGKLYDITFSEDLSGAQVIVAVLLYRIAENRRRRPRASDPNFVRYASAFIAMQMGRRLLVTLGNPATLGHRDFTRAQAEIDANGEAYFEAASRDVAQALKDLYGDREISLQQLSATFRRGDLIDRLQAIHVSPRL
ncbi:putative abortive infection phage resistance protein [Enhygromyxa salina]|uniref:Putative abortive infection phage resistance protein n=1 Tax=Enhygromyxa salina TaxID=215803 RepID=A0A0C1ZID2_9BACT|nr:AIPR family protein [Enhygromyxa salina]KIG17294.1 putative abortive infection phage resistance protein [Enhygromyxa salina]